MGRLTIRLPDDQHARLKAIARSRGISLNTLFEAFTTRVIAESDASVRFQAAAAREDTHRGLACLKRLDRHFGD